MSDTNTRFGTMLNCMDGRTQEPVVKWMKEQLGVDVVDAPNPAGPTNIIVNGHEQIVNHYKDQVLVSINGHHSQHLVIVAHQECAANPIADEEQVAQLKEACEILKTKWGLPGGVHVIGLWLTKKTDLEWDINCIINDIVPTKEEILV